MGVFKWLRRERVTVTTRHVSPSPEPNVENENIPPVGTIRTEEYKRDLAEFQARRSSGAKDNSPIKKKCGRHSLPVSCTDCSTDHDHTFNYEKKSANKYKKKTQRRVRSSSEEKTPNIQFLFHNQVFMPGNVFTSYSEPSKYRRQPRSRCRSPDFVQKQIDFTDDQIGSPPIFYKNNSLPFDVKNFLECSRGEEEVDGLKGGGDKVSSCSSKNDSCEEKLWEVMSELKNLEQWADEQLTQAPTNISKSDDNNCDTSLYGLPIAGSSDIDVTTDKEKVWNHGKWGVVPVQVKKISGVTLSHVLKKTNTEINLLRKCRHPNIILLMGIFPDVQNNVHIICEICVDSLFNILHVQGRILSAQTSVHYALDIANALVFLRMHGYIHTELTSKSVMITKTDTAKLADLEACLELKSRKNPDKHYEEYYPPEPQYVNIADTTTLSNLIECEPLISQHPSEVYLSTNAVGKEYEGYKNTPQYRWQAPELFQPDEMGLVYACSKSDVYSLSLILWESCNAAVPWNSLSYEKLKEIYLLWKTGIRLPQDGTYPGSLLDLLQNGLKLPRDERINLTAMQNTLQKVKHNLDNMEYIVIPARITKKKSAFSSAWDPNSPTDSNCNSPVHRNIEHKAVVHDSRDSSIESDRDCSRSDDNALYESIVKDNATLEMPKRCYASDEYIDNTDDARPARYGHLPENEYSSACSTPITKIRARIKDIGTPGTLHRSDSTEYCSIMSPDRRAVNFGHSNDSNNDQSSERPISKLSRSFTPKSYKPLHIKVPEFNFDPVKTLLKDQNGSEKSSYSFDIKNYSLPSMPIARSNKLRKNAWLSGDLGDTLKRAESLKSAIKTASEELKAQVNSEPVSNINSSIEKEPISENNEEGSPESVENYRNVFTGLRRTEPPSDFTSPETDDHTRDRTNSWSYKSSTERSHDKPEDDVLASVNVKPLVAIHERWIYEANRKTGRSLSLPENNRCQNAAVKPASHCVDTFQKSLPQLNKKSLPKYRSCPSPGSAKSGGQWEQFCHTRDTIARSMNFATRDSDRFSTYKKEVTSKCTSKCEETLDNNTKIDRSTDTLGIEEFIRDLIRKEFQQLLLVNDGISTTSTCKNEDLVSKGVSNIVESLKNGDSDSESDLTVTKDTVKSFSRLKIKGNDKPLLEIIFSRNGENNLQILDNCVNVTVCDMKDGAKERLNLSMEETLTEEVPSLLKRCQTFNALQEARSTEDLYIDDDISTQMQENFGGKVKLIPLHGSLHEILCEKEDDCCLIKVKQENGCDTIYFRCDNSDTESRDAIDGSHDPPQDTVVYKRSISVIEERIQRIKPKDKPVPIRINKTRPKSEIFHKTLNKDTRLISNSSPSLYTRDQDEVEVNIENVMSYQDSSSEECLRCQQENEDFEMLERKIEEDIAVSRRTVSTCGCLEKISEENLASSDDFLDRY